MCMSILLAYISMYLVHKPGTFEGQKRELVTLELEFWRSEEDLRSPRTVVAGDCEAAYRCWEPNPSLLQQRQSLTTEPSPSPMSLENLKDAYIFSLTLRQLNMYVHI